MTDSAAKAVEPPVDKSADAFSGGTMYPDKIERKLIRPIMAHDREFKSLTLRAPLTSDALECGFPIDIDFDSGKISMREMEMARMIARLGDIPMSSVGKLHPADFSYFMARLQVFFIPLSGEGGS